MPKRPEYIIEDCRGLCEWLAPEFIFRPVCVILHGFPPDLVPPRECSTAWTPRTLADTVADPSRMQTCDLSFNGRHTEIAAQILQLRVHPMMVIPVRLRSPPSSTKRETEHFVIHGRDIPCADRVSSENADKIKTGP